MKTLILCAGYGTRLKPLTDKKPKPLLEVQGVPILGHMLKHLSGLGIREVMINLHCKGEQIRDYCQKGEKWNLSVEYFEEAQLLGGAGTVKALQGWFTQKKSEEEFLVIYGDLLCNEDFLALQNFHREKKALATILVYEGRDNSIVKRNLDGKIEFFYERPEAHFAEKIYQQNPGPLFVNGGIQILSTHFFSYIPDLLPCDLPRDIYAKIAGQEALFAYPLKKNRLNIDSYEALQVAQNLRF
ncbi:MAG: nucleotidyltransferase family protein [Deltaproteobacteria bacterium]|nr:nucleotidyltransferase family protein [Deltaproteobacteria bacterium]